LKSTTRLLRKENIDDERSRSIERDVDLKNALAQYCSQINELKQVALDSQDKIAILTEELAKEKKESSKLREEIHRSSKFTKFNNMTQEEIATSEEENNQKDWDLPQPYYISNPKNNNKSRPKSVLENILNKGQKNKTVTDQRQRRQKENTQFFNTVLDTTKERSTDLSNLKHRFCETGIQCDLKDNTNASIIYQNEQKIKEQEARINHLEAEVEKFKSHKNEMIATFQQIVGLLCVSSEQPKAKSPQRKSQDIKGDFSNFYQLLNAKLSGVPSAQTQTNLRGSKMNGTASYLGVSRMSRHNKTEISDNLMYSPSNFDDDMLDSKYASSIRPYIMSKGASLFNGKASGSNQFLNSLSPKDLQKYN